MSDAYGQTILKALNALKGPATMNEIVSKIVNDTGCEQRAIKVAVKKALHHGVRFGYLNMAKGRYSDALKEIVPSNNSGDPGSDGASEGDTSPATSDSECPASSRKTRRTDRGMDQNSDSDSSAVNNADESAAPSKKTRATNQGKVKSKNNTKSQMDSEDQTIAGKCAVPSKNTRRTAKRGATYNKKAKVDSVDEAITDECAPPPKIRRMTANAKMKEKKPRVRAVPPHRHSPDTAAKDSLNCAPKSSCVNRGKNTEEGKQQENCSTGCDGTEEKKEAMPGTQANDIKKKEGSDSALKTAQKTDGATATSGHNIGPKGRRGRNINTRRKH